MSCVEIEFAGRRFKATEETRAKLEDPEPPLRYLEKVGPGDVFVDVGAGVGLYALRAAAMGAKVIAFEPHGPTREQLIRNFRLNDADFRGGFLPIRCGLFDGGPYPEELAEAVFGKHYPLSETERAKLGFAKLDEFRFPGVTWVKLDVEGAELGVLQGAVDTLQRCRPTLLVEDHDIVGPDPDCAVTRYARSVRSSERIRELLGGFGYRVAELPWGCGRRFLVAESG